MVVRVRIAYQEGQYMRVYLEGSSPNGFLIEMGIDSYDTHKERVAYDGMNFYRTGRTYAGLRVYKFRSKGLSPWHDGLKYFQ